MLEFVEEKTKGEGTTQRKSSRNLHEFLLSLLLNTKLHTHRGKLCSHEKNDWRGVSRTIPKALIVLREICNQSREIPLNT